MNEPASLQNGSARKRRGALEPPRRRTCRVSEQRQERDEGDEEDPDETNESRLRMELERLSKEDLIERIIRFKEVRNEFANLPDEIVVSIFKYLPRATLAKTARVSKDWQRISYDPTFWKNVEFKNRMRPLKSGTLGQVLARGCQRLTIRAGRKIAKPIFTDDKPKKSYAVKELDLRMFMLPSDLISILDRCPKLVRLTIHETEFDYDVCTQLVKCRNLKEVVFGEYRNSLTYAGYLLLFTGCPRLEIFRPNRMSWGPAQFASARYSADEVRSLIKVLPPTLQGISCFRQCFVLTDEHIELLVTKVPNVQSLHLSNCPLLTEKSVGSLSRLSQLYELDINYCSRIPYSVLGGLLESCKSLRFLAVDGVVTAWQGDVLSARYRNVRISWSFPSDNSEDVNEEGMSDGSNDDAVINLVSDTASDDDSLTFDDDSDDW